ncbi:response regulator transcription factor [Novosphingobium sp. P6W]|uniref:response regulator transcription factor n=1 Tax=Novosphingobium sp. P6W TaxID=1609758 RepID=UPI0005C2E0CB|nr:response regulator [Novosphingobium sp. P6W]AXB80706.1 DNA-binding response regulator [Novosphingobium sp. P6W]KIS29521.1 response regulator receiver protein [Novosphingobium sp. P6W]
MTDPAPASTHGDALPVAVLDDDADLAATVARLLTRNGIAAQAFVAPQELLAALPACTFGCVVSDIQMGAIDGFAFADLLRASDPLVALVFMTAWPTTAHAVDAVRRHGGLDYLEKPIDEPRLIASVLEGLAWSIRERRIAAVTATFTRREREVFSLLVRAHSNKEIAERLAISARTVEDHRAAIVAKTRTNGLAQLVALSRGEEP